MASIHIISIKRRNWFQRMWSISHWNVKVRYMGNIYYLTCWGGVEKPNPESLLFDIQRELIKKINPKGGIKEINNLVGKDVDYE